MYAFIRNYKIEQKEYPVANDLNTSKATLTLDIEVIEQGKQITPEVLIYYIGLKSFTKKIILINKGGKRMLDGEFFAIMKDKLMDAITIVGYVMILHTSLTAIVDITIYYLLKFKNKWFNNSKKSDKSSKE